MKRGQVIVLSAAVVAAGIYFYYYRAVRPHGTNLSSANSTDSGAQARLEQMKWQMITRPDEGFRVELPAEPKELQIPAYNEMGGAEPVKMLFASPDGNTTYAVAWDDSPPVARVNDLVPDRTLEQARDGMLARTNTTKVSESRISGIGYPGIDVKARNKEGGFLDARLIFMNDRLYTLLALYPSMNARREQDVTRFHNSFAPLRVGTRLPDAPAKAM